MDSTTAICNVGLGINLSNSNPTVCINNLIKEYNLRYGKKLPELAYELALATIFTEIEMLYNKVQLEGIEYLIKLYYQYWLHT